MPTPTYLQIAADLDQRITDLEQKNQKITDLEQRIAALEEKTKYLSVNSADQTTYIAAGPNRSFAVQQDGNVVIYDSRGKALWATGTNG